MTLELLRQGADDWGVRGAKGYHIQRMPDGRYRVNHYGSSLGRVSSLDAALETAKENEITRQEAAK